MQNYGMKIDDDGWRTTLSTFINIHHTYIIMIYYSYTIDIPLIYWYTLDIIYCAASLAGSHRFPHPRQKLRWQLGHATSWGHAGGFIVEDGYGSTFGAWHPNPQCWSSMVIFHIFHSKLLIPFGPIPSHTIAVWWEGGGSEKPGVLMSSDEFSWS